MSLKPSVRQILFGKRRPWTPANIATALWLDANDASTITLNGSTVSQWNDKSGNERHAAQATAANQPTYTANGLNGKPVLTFDGLNDFLTAGTTSSFNFFHNGQESAAVAVCRFGNTGSDPDANYSLFTNGGGASGDTGIDMSFEDRSPNNNALSVSVSRSVPGSFPVSSFVDNIITPGQWIIPSIRMDADNSTPANRAIGNVNGGANITGNTSSVSPALGNASFPMHIGSGVFSYGFYSYLLGAVSEIIFINSALSTTDRQRIEGYLAHKWGLTANLPSDHPYKTTPPTV